MKSRDIGVAVGLLLVLSVFSVGWNLGGPPVTDLMEVRNLVTAREMTDTGRWLIPTMNGALRLEKPPLPTWAAAAAGSVGGFRNLWALRFPTLLLGVLGAIAVAAYTRRLGASPEAALGAGFVLVTMFLYARHGRLATWDVPTHALAMAGIAAFVEAGQRRRLPLAVLSALLLSAASLSKGPVSFGVMVLPWLAASAIWCRPLLHGRRSDVAILLALTVLGTAAWPLYVYWHEPAQAAAVAFRETDAWLNRHVRPVWYYAGFPVFAGAWIPTALAVLVSPFCFRDYFSRREVRATYTWMWLSMLVVSMVPTKKERYLLPVLFPLAILIALWWEHEGQRALAAATRVMRAQVWFAGVAGAAAVCAGTVLAGRGTIHWSEAAVAISLVAAGLAGFAVALRWPAALPARALVATLLVTAGVMSAGWHIQDRLEPAQMPLKALQDIGRSDGWLDAPLFAHDPGNLYLVWGVGRPLLPYPDSRARLTELAVSVGQTPGRGSAVPSQSMSLRAGWLSLFPPGADPVLAKLQTGGMTVAVEATGRWRAAQDRQMLHYSRVRFIFPPPADPPPRQ